MGIAGRWVGRLRRDWVGGTGRGLAVEDNVSRSGRMCSRSAFELCLAETFGGGEGRSAARGFDMFGLSESCY